MTWNKKTITLTVLVSFVLLASAFNRMPGDKGRNLKVLPADISDAKLDSIMQTYNKALGVSCNFCHVQAKSVYPVPVPGDNLDFALDNDMKENARRMMRITIHINKTFFYFDSTARPEYLNVIHCKTCHRGAPFPPED